MRRKLISLLLCGTMAASALTGCDKMDNRGGSGNRDNSKKTVGIAMPAQSLERWNRDGSYLQKQFEEAGYNVSIAYSDNDTKKQVNDIQKLISEDVDILIIAAVDGESLSTVLKDAKDAKIPVISYDRLIRNTDAVSYYVSFDNYKVGQLQGQYVIDTLDLNNAGNKTYNMEVTAGDTVDNNAAFFYNGAMDTLKKYIDAGTIKIPSGQQEYEKVAIAQWDAAKAMNRMENILNSFYSDGKTKLDVALCSNDSTALGVTQAILSDYKGGNMPIITGQDGDEENLKNILDGKQSMTVYKAVENETIVTLKLAKELLEGKQPAEDLCDALKEQCEVKYDTESYDNGVLAVPSYLLTPDTVTKQNYKELLVDTGYYTIGEDGYLQAAG